MDILPKFLSPIGRLGHNAKKYSIEFEDKPTNIRGYYDYTNEYRNEGLIPSINIRDTRDLDSAKIPPTYRKFYTSNPENPTFEHEAIHRGLNILYNYYRDDVPSFTKKYGKDTWEFLKKANSFQSHLKNIVREL